MEQVAGVVWESARLERTHGDRASKPRIRRSSVTSGAPRHSHSPTLSTPPGTGGTVTRTAATFTEDVHAFAGLTTI